MPSTRLLALLVVAFLVYFAVVTDVYVQQHQQRLGLSSAALRTARQRFLVRQTLFLARERYLEIRRGKGSSVDEQTSAYNAKKLLLNLQQLVVVSNQLLSGVEDGGHIEAGGAFLEVEFGDVCRLPNMVGSTEIDGSDSVCRDLSLAIATHGLYSSLDEFANLIRRFIAESEIAATDVRPLLRRLQEMDEFVLARATYAIGKLQQERGTSLSEASSTTTSWSIAVGCVGLAVVYAVVVKRHLMKTLHNHLKQSQTLLGMIPKKLLQRLQEKEAKQQQQKQQQQKRIIGVSLTTDHEGDLRQPFVPSRRSSAPSSSRSRATSMTGVMSPPSPTPTPVSSQRRRRFLGGFIAVMAVAASLALFVEDGALAASSPSLWSSHIDVVLVLVGSTVLCSAVPVSSLPLLLLGLPPFLGKDSPQLDLIAETALLLQTLASSANAVLAVVGGIDVDDVSALLLVVEAGAAYHSDDAHHSRRRRHEASSPVPTASLCPLWWSA